MKRILFLVALFATAIPGLAQTSQGSQFQRTYSKSLDYYFGKTVGGIGWPWASTTEANNTIPITRRYDGMIILVGADSTSSRLYYYHGGRGNSNLQLFTGDTTGLGLETRAGGAAKYAQIDHTHAATAITQDATHRFVTDAEKATWNAGGGSSAGGAGAARYTLTGTQIKSTGKLIILPVLDSGIVVSMVINDIAKNTGWTQSSDSLTFTDATTIDTGDVITFSFAHAPPSSGGSGTSPLATAYDFYPEDYGAVGDVKRTYTTITGGSATITSTEAPWTSADVGKLIKVAWADTNGNDLVTTIAGFNNAGSITIGRTVTGSDVNAMTYWGTDDTGPVQACLNAAGANKRSHVILSKKYLINGPVIDSLTVTGGKISLHSQLYLPYHTYLSNDGDRGCMEIDGLVAHCLADNGPGNVGLTRPSMSFSGFVSFRTSSDTTAAVIGAGGLPASNGGFTYIVASFKKVKILVPSNNDGVGTGIGGINVKRVVATRMEDVTVNVDDNLQHTALPVYHHVGIDFNDIQADNGTYMNNVQVYGQYIGMRMGEHDAFGTLGVFGCYYPMEFKQQNYMIAGTLLSLNWNKRTFLVTGQTGVNIAACNIESMTSPDPRHGGNMWWSTDADGLFDDLGVPQGNGSPYARGRIVVINQGSLTVGPWPTAIQIITPGQLGLQD